MHVLNLLVLFVDEADLVDLGLELSFGVLDLAARQGELRLQFQVRVRLVDLLLLYLMLLVVGRVPLEGALVIDLVTDSAQLWHADPMNRNLVPPIH